MEKFKFAAPCLLGIEGICADELKRLEIENVCAENGRVTFEGDMGTLARANICSRYAERIQILLAEFPAYTFDDLFEGVKKIPWENFIGEKEAFPVKGHSVNSKLTSIPACQKIIKKAAAERLSRKYHTSWLEESGSLHQIQFLIMKNQCSIMLDTSGQGLHKRGYRANAAAAPIKETLAAAMADISRVRPFSTVIDPFCGSGTILIESALKALNIAPGIKMRFTILHRMTKKLPLVEAEENEMLPLFGRNTRDAIAAGVIRGVVFEVKGYMRDLQEQIPHYKTIITGGNAPFILHGLQADVRFERHLVLIGLNQILLYNTKQLQ